MRETATQLVTDCDPPTTWSSPVIVVDRHGTVRSVTSSAQALIPGLAEGVDIGAAASWLASAQQTWLRSAPDVEEHVLKEVSGSAEGLPLLAHPAELPGGDVAWTLMGTTNHEERELSEALTRQRERQRILLEASSNLMMSLNIDSCRKTIALMAARHLADAAVVVTPAGRRLHTCSSNSAGVLEQQTIDEKAASVDGLREALGGFPPVPSRWLDPALLPDWLVPASFTGPVQSAMIVSLPGQAVVTGALVLLRGADAAAYDENDEMLARQFSVQAGSALFAAARYAEQAAVTGALLRGLSPPELHSLNGIDYAACYLASGDYQNVGGDFYDLHPGPNPEDEALLVLGDVCGKGIEAAVMTGKIRNTLQALAPLSGDHGVVLELLNRSLLSSERARFATLVLASVRRRDEDVVLRLTRAGHLPPLIVRNNGSVEEVNTPGTLIGALPNIKVETLQTCLAPGEVCVLYTDGVTEARGGHLERELFGERRLAAALRGSAGMPAEAVVEQVMTLTTEWVGSRPHDDIAVVAITSPSRTHLSAVDGHTRGRYTA